MDYYYLEALNELNVMCPTGTEEEKGLARYLEFNDREDHERRLGDKQREPVRPSGTVSGSFTTLLSPGMSNALSGGLGGIGGGYLQGLGLANGYQQQQRNLAAQLGAQQQQLSAFELLSQQRSMMQMGTNQNNINPLADLAAALRESKKLDS